MSENLTKPLVFFFVEKIWDYYTHKRNNKPLFILPKLYFLVWKLTDVKALVIISRNLFVNRDKIV